MEPKTEAGLNNIIVHPAVEAGWARFRNRKFAIDRKNLIDAMQRAVKFLRGAPDEPRFYFIAFVLREYEQLLNALIEMRPDNSNYPTQILNFHAKLSEVQERLNLSLETLSENPGARSRSAPCG